MKSITINKDNGYSLLSSENYKKDLNSDVVEVTKKYSHLIIEYYKFIIENLKITNIGLSKFIIMRGLDTITNVFLHLLYATKNLNLTYFHCQKSFYFYVEFVSQISDIEKTFLQLTSRDATTYVYKKTIFDIKNEFKKISDDEEEFKSILEIIQSNINISQTYLLKIIKTNTKDLSIIDSLTKIVDRLNNIQNKTNKQILAKIVDILYYKVDNITTFIEINSLLIKKFIKSPGIVKNVEKKCDTIEIDVRLLETPDKFINWIISPLNLC
jgi:hypothetical protein